MEAEPSNGPSTLRAVARRLRVERQRTVDERDAFDSFRERLEGIPTGGTAGEPGRAPAVIRPSRRGLAAVREAYEATVMSVPHFLDEYDESYGAHLSREFGPDLAAALTEGSKFGVPCKRRLLAECEAARDKREDHLRTLAAERESFEKTKSTVDAVLDRLQEVPVEDFGEEGPDALDIHRTRLSRLERRTDELAAERRAAIRTQQRRLSIPDGAPDLQQYLYEGLESVYPMLSVVGELGHLLAVRERAVESAAGTSATEPSAGEPSA